MAQKLWDLTPGTVTSTGYQELHAIGHLALLGTLFVVAVPLLILACTYLPWRLRAGRTLSAPLPASR